MKKLLCGAVVLCACLLTALAAQSVQYESDLISVSTQGNQDGQDVILIHGFASSSEVWSGSVEQLSEDYHLHLVQIKGFAGADKPKKVPQNYLKAIRDSIVKYVQSKELKQPAMVGHSMGGLLSLITASDEPNLVSNVIVVDALPFYSLMFNPMATSEQIKPMAEQTKKQMLALDDEQFTSQVKRSAGIMTKVEAKQALVEEWSLNSDRAVYANLIAEIMAYDARAELSQIEAPVTVINAFDNNMPMNKEYLIQLYQSAYSDTKAFELRTIDDSYHFIMWDQPEAFYQHLKQSLKQ